MRALDRIAEDLRRHRGLRGKGSLRLVGEVLGATDWLRGPGDDASALPIEGGHLLLAGEAIWPPFVAADPFGAGAGAVVANVNDVAAMGGRPLAIVDTIVGPEEVARSVLEGMRFAADLYGVPVVGGHLTITDGPAGVSAFVAGRAGRLLATRDVAPGQMLLVAGCLEGALRSDFPFFSSIEQRGRRLAEDVAVLAEVADDGLAVAAKDVSMAGLLGSLAMLLEPTGSGAVIDLDRIPRPDDVPLETWVGVFPTYGFLLTASAEGADRCAGRFRDRGLGCRAVGEIRADGRLLARIGDDEAVLLDLSREAPTGLGSDG